MAQEEIDVYGPPPEGTGEGEVEEEVWIRTDLVDLGVATAEDDTELTVATGGEGGGRIGRDREEGGERSS